MCMRICLHFLGGLAKSNRLYSEKNYLIGDLVETSKSTGGHMYENPRTFEASFSQYLHY